MRRIETSFDMSQAGEKPWGSWLPFRRAIGARFSPLDGVVAGYTLLTALLIALRSHKIEEPIALLAFHGLVLCVLLALPARGADWELPRAFEPLGRKTLREAARFLRYTYPLLLVLFYFEEVEQTVHALSSTPYWFEPYLYRADLVLLGDHPSLILMPWVGPLLDEVMHAFYFSYYPILIGGVVIAWLGTRDSGRFPGPGFEITITSVITSFFVAYVWYPLLPARGPWENPELMARLQPLDGFVFKPIMDWIIERGAVSGGCFPSSHVAGSWGVVFGLARFHRRCAVALGCLAIGLSFSCVYTRYHHAIDIPAGFAAAVLGAYLAACWTPREGRR